MKIYLCYFTQMNTNNDVDWRGFAEWVRDFGAGKHKDVGKNNSRISQN